MQGSARARIVQYPRKGCVQSHVTSLNLGDDMSLTVHDWGIVAMKHLFDWQISSHKFDVIRLVSTARRIVNAYS